MRLTRIALAASDLASMAVAFCIALYLRQTSILASQFAYITFSTRVYLEAFIVGSLLLVLVFTAFRLYEVHLIERSARIFTVTKAFLVWVAISIAFTYLFKLDFSRGLFILSAIVALVLIMLGRYFLFLRRRRKTNDTAPEIIIIGTGSHAKSLETGLKNDMPKLSIKLVDSTDPRDNTFLESLSPSEIFLADEHLTREHALAILADPRFSHHTFRVILGVFRLVTGELTLGQLDEIPSIRISHKPHFMYVWIKRTTDIMLSALALLLALPAWIVIIVAIRLDSPGSIFIKQIRSGKNGEPFMLIKFRSMKSDTSLYEYAPENDEDARLTRIGRILRRFSLDELPQLWNILKGDMSLVGPRPEMEFIVKNYSDWQKIRLTATPGLTGLWQILGRKDIPLQNNLEYDFYYVNNRSLLLDSTILLKTIPAVLFGRGAY